MENIIKKKAEEYRYLKKANDIKIKEIEENIKIFKAEINEIEKQNIYKLLYDGELAKKYDYITFVNLLAKELRETEGE